MKLKNIVMTIIFRYKACRRRQYAYTARRHKAVPRNNWHYDTYRRLLIIACVAGAIALFGNSIYIQAKAKLAQYLIANAWQTTLEHHQPTPPWSWADTYPVAKLSVPKLAISHYVLAGANGSPLAFGPGLYAGTKGIGEQQSQLPNSVIAGHHNTHFDFLGDLSIGDNITLQNAKGQTLDYRVANIATFDIRQQQLPALYNGQTVQLVTCLPRFVGEIHPNLRLVVTLQQQHHQVTKASIVTPLISRYSVYLTTCNVVTVIPSRRNRRTAFDGKPCTKK